MMDFGLTTNSERKKVGCDFKEDDPRKDVDDQRLRRPGLS